MTKPPNKKVDLLLSDLEGRVAGVLARFFEGRKITLEEIGREISHDPELLELSVATNALLFQLASVIVMLHRKTGGDLNKLIGVETRMLKSIVPVCKGVRDSLDEPVCSTLGVS